MTAQMRAPAKSHAVALAERGIAVTDERLRLVALSRCPDDCACRDWRYDVLLDRRLTHMKVRDALGGNCGTG